MVFFKSKMIKMFTGKNVKDKSCRLKNILKISCVDPSRPIVYIPLK